MGQLLKQSWRNSIATTLAVAGDGLQNAAMGMLDVLYGMTVATWGIALVLLSPLMLIFCIITELTERD